jgi:sec-independent protein translocase protein TatA
MGTFGVWQWVIVLVIVLLLFGRGKIPGLMGDMAKGLKAFRKGMKDDDDDTVADSPKTLASDGEAARNVTPEGESAKRKDEASKA